MLKVAILGFGVVGLGVAEVLDKNSAQIAKRAGQDITLKYILDIRDFPDSPYRDKFVRDFAVIEQDPEVEAVVETIGGTAAAREFTIRALRAGKSVISSNKELVAEHGRELLELAAAQGVRYLFEASVGGGIPILRPLNQCLAANELTEVCGILNGTTNFILTRMIQTGCSFESALSEAQEKGYAERDPSADIEGHDACRKICILASIAFGRHILPAQVPTEGVTGVSLADVAYADSQGCKIKLLGRAIRREDGRVTAYVAPHLVGANNPLSGVEDVFNAITVKGDVIGETMFYGRGAGKLPTASAVVADVMDIARNPKGSGRMLWRLGGSDATALPDDLVMCWYVRANASAARVRSAVESSTLLSRAGAPAGEVAFLTAYMKRQELDAALQDVEIKSVFRLLD